MVTEVPAPLNDVSQGRHLQTEAGRMQLRVEYRVRRFESCRLRHNKSITSENPLVGDMCIKNQKNQQERIDKNAGRD